MIRNRSRRTKTGKRGKTIFKRKEVWEAKKKLFPIAGNRGVKKREPDFVHMIGQRPRNSAV
jgi:hypothetical protein